MKKATVRKQSQRFVSLSGKGCEKCGASGYLNRHHVKMQRKAIMILCVPCHVREHQKNGTRRVKRPKSCAVCGKDFMPRHSKKHKTCSPNCLSELGRLNARKRWDAR